MSSTDMWHGPQNERKPSAKIYLSLVVPRLYLFNLRRSRGAPRSPGAVFAASNYRLCSCPAGAQNPWHTFMEKYYFFCVFDTFRMFNGQFGPNKRNKSRSILFVRHSGFGPYMHIIIFIVCIPFALWLAWCGEHVRCEAPFGDQCATDKDNIIYRYNSKANEHGTHVLTCIPGHNALLFHISLFRFARAVRHGSTTHDCKKMNDKKKWWLNNQRQKTNFNSEWIVIVKDS